VGRTLVSRYRQKVSTNKFTLKIQVLFEPDYVPTNRWIGYAIECNVKELNLYLKSYYCEYSDDVPESVLIAKSIIKLKLCGGRLKSSYSDINLSSLRELVLKRVTINDGFFQTLISGYPALEEITIGNCYGLKNIHVARLPRLMAVTLLYNPRLESFKMEARNLKKLLLEKLYNLKVENSKLKAPNLRKLLLKSIIVTDKWLHNVLSKHPLIESLELCYCSMLKMIKISSGHLKSLTICFCTNLVEVNIITLNLHRFKYYGDAISFSSNTWTLSEVVLHFHNYAHLDVEKIEFLTKLNHPKFLAWDANCVKVF
jgi:hypothetical protein